MMQKMISAVRKYVLNREVLTYLVSGVIVTLFNWFIFTLIENALGFAYWRLANVTAIFLSILLAYLLNRWLVFRSNQPVFPEIVRFFASRLLISAIFEQGAMELMFTVFHFYTAFTVAGKTIYLAKILAQIAVVVGNYIVGKLLVFRQS